MLSKVIPVAAIAALVGAIAWAVITVTTGFEIGYVAWGIGLLVGVAGRGVGGYGQPAGVVCAILALAAIFTGKVLSTQYMIQQAQESIADELTEAFYEESMRDAEDFAAITSEEQYLEFMASHGYGEAVTADEVSKEELAYFKSESVPYLHELQKNKPSYTQWREQLIEESTQAMMENTSVVQVVIDDLNAIDIIFALLGIATAYKLVASVEPTVEE